ncbi:Tyrosinase [Neofusicoccum parvum]|uniref:Tyrosinase n=1 Tax=Neofusicoccum parvum TaxID=310453 RepID=A0ACB5SAS9_9PEZI|nr:Tyrosinase [Neofusicoccum parvum]
MASIADFQAKGIVAGLASVSDAKPLPRYEIDDLMAKHPDTFNVFLLALERLQDDKERKKKNHLLTSQGIHGLPARPWDGVVDVNKVRVESDRSTRIGYCAHKDILFPTWHRPYLAMMEQTIYATMQEIAADFTDPKYRTAARTFRLPYWDYFRPRERKDTGLTGFRAGKQTSFPYDFGLPAVLRSKKLMVYRPKTNETKPVDMDNPLMAFNFPKTDGLTSTEWKRYPVFSQQHTVRHPTDNNREKDDFDDLDKSLNWAREPGLTYMLNMMKFPAYANYENFARASVLNLVKNPTSGSLESFHDFYHGQIGGGGHMSVPELAAFDPVFWFHHCNVDRILAVWQATHDGYISTTGQLNASSPLYPFRKPNPKGDASFWNSDSIRKPETFGYTYPDLQESTDRKSILEQFVAKYDWSTQRQVGSKGTGIPSEMEPVELETFIDSEVLKDALDGTFTIYFFVGPVREIDTNPSKWKNDPILAGVNHVLTANEEACDNCAQQSADGMKVSGTSAITPILLDYVEYNRQARDPDQVSGLKVRVSATISVLHPHARITEFKEALFPDVTSNHHSGNPAGQ